jgi:hypothetical protein
MPIGVKKGTARKGHALVKDNFRDEFKAGDSEKDPYSEGDSRASHKVVRGYGEYGRGHGNSGGEALDDEFGRRKLKVSTKRKARNSLDKALRGERT